MINNLFHTIILILIYTIFFYGVLYYLSINHKNYKKRKLTISYIIKTYINIVISFITILFVYLNKEKLFTPTNRIDIKNIIFYFILVDTLYYWFHRISHRIPIIKSYIHSTHHNLFYLLPLDYANLNIVDFNMYMFINVVFPLLITNTSIFEYLIITTIMFLHSVYIHSDVNFKFFIPLFITSKYHKYHHQIGGGNYGQFFSIWDEYMNTRLKKCRLSKKI